MNSVRRFPPSRTCAKKEKRKSGKGLEIGAMPLRNHRVHYLGVA
jgi:hypothetical protein